jgi:hypothetical protein
MYDIILTIHFWNRRLILLFGVTAIVLAYHGWKSKRIFSPLDNLLGTTFMGSLHIQLILGLFLYFVFSPKTAYALAHFAEAMKDSKLRYFAMEHGFIMVLAIGIAQLGRILVHKTHDHNLKHKRSLIYFSIALIMILLMVPFGNSQQGLPLFRF